MSETLNPAMAKRIEVWPIEKIVPYEKNARTHNDEQVGQIASSILEFGFVNPILLFLLINAFRCPEFVGEGLAQPAPASAGFILVLCAYD